MPSGQIRLTYMRQISLFLILIASVFACDNEIINNAADFEFETIDKDANKIELIVTIRYRIKSRFENKLSRKYGRYYKDSLFLPAISAISKKVLQEYSAGEIYNYKRDEIEQRLGGQTKTTFAEYDLELTAFLIRSVGLSDTLLSRFEKEHVVRFQNAMIKCSREIKGVVIEIDSLRNGDRIVLYEFTIENKKYKGVLASDEDSYKMSFGDTLAVEYACEDAIFHRLKK
jgi:hypothetical protein